MPTAPRQNAPNPDVATAYDRWSATYDSDVNATRDLDAVVLRRSALNLEGKRVVELGCGTGKNTGWIANAAAGVTALDFSAGMLSHARQRVSASHVRFVYHDLRNPWPLEDQSADVIIGNLVLEHVGALAPIFAEAARVLTPGGQLYLCELHPYRQLRGGQAHFADAATGQVVALAAYLHSTSEYVNTGIAAGFTLDALGEWTEGEADEPAPPRLLSLLFRRG